MLHCLDFLGRWKWPNLVVISVVPLAAYYLSWAPQNKPRPFGVTIFGPARLGPWAVVLGANEPLDAEADREVILNVRFCTGCYEQMRRAALAFGDAHGPSGAGTLVTGNPNALHVSLPVPVRAPPSGLYLWVTTEDWAGMAYRVSWKVAPGQAHEK